MKKLLLLFFTATLLWGQEQEFPPRLTLEEAIQVGLENNRILVNASRDVQKAYKTKWSTIAKGLPQLNASFNYQNFLEQPVSLVPAQFFGGQEGEFAEVVFGTKQNLDAQLKWDQLIFDGTYLVGLEATQVYLTISENLFEKTSLETRKSIINAYTATLLAGEQARILQRNVNTLKGNLSEVTQLFVNGFEEEESVQQMQLTLSETEIQLRYANNVEKIALNMLRLLLGYPDTNPLELTYSLQDLITAGLFKEPLTTDIQLSNNMDVKIAVNNVKSEQLLYKLERVKALPRLTAFLSGGYTGNGDSFEFLNRNQKWFGSSLVGVTLQMPIFSSLDRTANTQKAKISWNQAQTILLETQQRVSLEIENGQNEYKRAVDLYFSSKKNLALAEKIENKNKTKYFEGMATSFELRQAQAQLYTAQNNYIKAIQNLVSAKTELETLLNKTEE